MLVGAGATLQLQGGLSIAKSITLNGGTIDSLVGNSQTSTTTNTNNGAANGTTIGNSTGNYLGGEIFLGSSSTINVDANQLTLSGGISGAADVSKNGGGTLVLAGTSTYTGQTNINAGIVQLTVPTTQNNTNSNVISPLGAVTGSAVVANNATLQLNTTFAGAQSNNNYNTSVTYASKTLVLTGAGLGLNSSGGLLEPTGALENIANTPNIPGTVNFPATWVGSIVLNSIVNAPNVFFSNTAGVNVGSGTQVAFTTASPNLSPLTFTGVISGSGGLTKVGQGTIDLQAAETYSGATTVTVGTLYVNGVGQILNTSGAILNPTAVINAATVTADLTALTVDNNAVAFSEFVQLNGATSQVVAATTGITLVGRLMNGANPANVQLNNSTFNFIGSNTPGVLTTDSLGTVTVNSARSYFDQTSGSGLKGDRDSHHRHLEPSRGHHLDLPAGRVREHQFHLQHAQQHAPDQQPRHGGDTVQHQRQQQHPAVGQHRHARRPIERTKQHRAAIRLRDPRGDRPL